MKQKLSIVMSRAVILAILLTLGQPLLIHAQALQADITPACTPSPPGLVSWWPGAGNATDLVGTNHGTLEGGVTFVAGQVGQAFQFDGAGEVEMAGSPSLNVQAFTIDAWIFPTAADSGVDAILNKEPAYGFSTLTTQYEIGIRGSYEPGLGIIPEGNFAFFIGGISGLPNEYRAWVDGGGPIPHNEWTHVALTFDGTAARAYINGALTREVHGLSGTVPTLPSPLKIGSRSDTQVNQLPQEPFNGRIDEVDLFSRALTGTEIEAIYNAGPSGKCEPGPQQPDFTPPVIIPKEEGWMGENGWYASAVTVSWTVVDEESAISSSSGCEPTFIWPDTTGVTLTCSATSAGGTSSQSVTIRIDTTPPEIHGYVSPAPNSYGWNNTDVRIWFECYDYASGVMYCEPEYTFTEEGYHSVYARAVDWAWWDERGGAGARIDKTPPTVSLVGGPANSGKYYFGFVPAAPTCSASDALSGLDGNCTVTGYSTAVGTHTVSASATDKAGNSASASATYTVLGWTLNGFYKPVKMNDVVNIVKSGSTVLLKFEVFAGPKELTATSVIQSFVQTQITCDTHATMDEIKITSVRYDATAGQFILTWQTPKQADACYRVTLKTQDGSSLVAFFKLK